MKNLLKYLIPILMIAALSYVAGRSHSSSQDALSCAFSPENHSFAELLSTPDDELSIPPQITTGTTNLQSNVRRTGNMHTRPLWEIVKSGKVFNVSLIYSVLRSTVIINTSIVEHSYKLVYLGKLII